MSQRKKKSATAAIGAGAIALVAWAGSQFIGGDANPNGSPHSEGKTRGGECTVSSLPPEAEDQIHDILTGAKPDDGAADGKHFGNYEGMLPKQNSSYYREYTVKTPGLNHRGERRIVVGGGTKTDPDTWYYSGDHFKSFCKITDAEG